MIGTFYGLSAVLAGGNIFVCTNRMVSNELAIEGGSPQKIFTYSATFCIILSLSVCGGIFALADNISALLKTPVATAPIRILALSLPLGTLSNCLKGYFHAHRKVTLPSLIDAGEFVLRTLVLVVLIQFFVLEGKLALFMAIALSTTISTACNALAMSIGFLKTVEHKGGTPSIKFSRFVVLAIPIAINSYIISALSSANDALIPLTLKQFGSSTEDAFSKFGIFEAIVLPALFFPAVIVSALSCILLPEISRAGAEGNDTKVRELTKKAMRRTLYFSVLVMVVFICFGDEIGVLAGGGTLAGEVITVMSPVIPLIYLEIVLEGILRGLGKYSFSTLNYIAEYVVRISVLLVCVPIMGFSGLVVSYMLSNIVGNLFRLRIISSVVGVKFRSLFF
jgi:stage V sporulation protein B